MSEIKIQDFFKNEYPNFAVYNLYRMVASYVDGLKPSQRKIIYTIMQNNIQKPIKVSQLAAKTSEFTQYLHGEVNLQGVIVNMTQDFTGTNNINVLYPESSFGNRCFPQAAAARYIYTRKSSSFDHIFNKDDTSLLPAQTFEGDEIEPQYFMPILPMILINGSEGIGSGWAQKILPRNPKDVQKEIQRYLAGKSIRQIKPWFKDFTGSIENVEQNTWELRGIVEQKNKTTFEITEIPPNISLDKFTSYLIKLEDTGSIVSFTDLSDPGTNKFHFVIKTKRDFSQKKTHEQIMKKFHLIKRVTENFTCMDENNQVKEFQNDAQILENYCDLRLAYYGHRKAKISQETQYLMATLRNKQRFIEDIIENRLEIKNLTKKEIIAYLKNHDYDTRDKTYNYLLNMPIYNISKDQFDKIKKEIIQIETELNMLMKKTEATLWEDDLKQLK